MHSHPEIVEKYLGSVVPIGDNYYATLNSAVFTDGSFVYVPKGVHCPMELSTYFRINDQEAGQFERTLIVAEEGSYVSYLEGCTAPAFSTQQLHAAVVELVAKVMPPLSIPQYKTGTPEIKRLERGASLTLSPSGASVQANHSRISWTQVEVGAAITWKYPSCILQGDHSIGEFYSVALTNGKMQADTGTKMVHLGKETSSTIILKGISADNSHKHIAAWSQMGSKAKGARNYTQCDSMLVGNTCSANTFPTIAVGECDLSGRTRSVYHPLE